MSRVFLAPMLIVGLGSFISFSQTQLSSDPFTRYLAVLKTGAGEPSLQKFALECGVVTAESLPRYAVGSGSSFAQVKDLGKGLRGLDTDFYSTAEVWKNEDRILVEIWANSDDVGSEVRYYKCFENGKLMTAEVIVWKLPLVKGPGLRAWGYSRRWERVADGRLLRTKAEFVDAMEHPFPEPKLNEDEKKSLRWTPPLGPVGSLNLPQSMLR